MCRCRAPYSAARSGEAPLGGATGGAAMVGGAAVGGAAGGAAIVGGIPGAPAGGAVLGINELATSIKQSIFCCIFWVDTLFGLIL